MTDSGKTSGTGAAVDYVSLHYLAETAEWRTDRYYRYAEMTDLVHGWVDAHPQIATLGSIGQTGEGREIWVVTITNRATGPDTEKPAYYVDANIHAGEVTGSSVALATIHHLLTRYGADEKITRLIDETTVYVIPRIMIDASEVYLTTADRMRSSIRTWPDRSDEIVDGIRVSDVDGDGVIAYMRVKDPDGPWKASAKDDRVMVARGPDETGGDYYFVHPEGTIDNWDGGAVRVAPPEWGLDLNRNMPRDWKPEWTQKGAGPYPLSEPETRAVADFILGHPNIHGSQHYHTQSRVILRASALRPDDELPEADLEAYKAIGKMGEEETGYKCVSIYHDFAYDKKKPIYGSFQDWMFDYVGVFSFATELWSLPMEAGCDVTDFIKWPKERTEDDDLKMLHLIDRQAGGRGFSPWRAFDHPQLGPVELGGWDFKFGVQNPQGPFLEGEINRNVPFTIRAMGTAPQLRFVDSGAEQLGDGVYRVWAVVGNSGFLPTYGSETARATGQPRPVKVTLDLPAGAKVGSASGRVEQEIGHLAGRSSQHAAFAQRSEYPNLSRKLVEWTVAAPAGTELPLTAATPRAGTVRATVTLG
ncbi:MAG TPA: M14 family metallopeptidase [Thermomicrobiales bacterium]|jgi:murein tripeptide amidase MpaA|nr:M14 family metallopeptidase [Thermomicrobiales bacterium]